MFFSFGSKEIKNNFFHLYSINNDYKLLNNENVFNNLKTAFSKILNKHMPIDILSVTESDPIIFLKDSANCKKMSTGYNLSKLDDLSQSDIITNTNYNVSDDEIDQYYKAIDKIKDISPDLHQIFRLAVNVIFFMTSNQASGGSTSGLPGVIWISPKNHWSIEDKVEFLIHELTHNLLFIDELTHDLYIYENMYKEEFWTKSAVLGKTRPLDKSFHSAVVGTELLLYRNAFGILPEKHLAHPPTDILLERTLISIESCLNSSLLLKRGTQILNKCSERLHSNVI